MEQTPGIVDVGGVADFSAAVGRAGRLAPRQSCRTVDAGTPKYRNFTGALYNALELLVSTSS